jgi:thiamine biosynthesis lipoprotein
VIADSSTDADAVTTALFILGPDQSMEILKQLPIEFIFVTNDMNLLISNGLKGNFELIRR